LKKRKSNPPFPAISVAFGWGWCEETVVQWWSGGGAVAVEAVVAEVVKGTGSLLW